MDDPSIDKELSDALRQPVVLTREAEVSHLDAAPVHLITSASLAWLQAALPGAILDARRFRPNLVIAMPGRLPVEQSWIGKRLLKVSAPTEHCGVVAFAQSELPDEPSILRHITHEATLHSAFMLRLFCLALYSCTIP